MSATSLQGHILTPTGFVYGSLHMGADGRIAGITGEPVSEAQVREGSAPIVLPGFIDLHVHGGAGHDIMEGGDAAWHVARLHAQHGTTSLLATTMTAPQSDLDAAFAALAPLCTEPARRPEVIDQAVRRSEGMSVLEWAQPASLSMSWWR